MERKVLVGVVGLVGAVVAWWRWRGARMPAKKQW